MQTKLYMILNHQKAVASVFMRGGCSLSVELFPACLLFKCGFFFYNRKKPTEILCRGVFIMKLSVLYTGYLEADAAGIVAGSSGSIRLPVLCFLIQAPGRNILFDTGCHPNAMAGHWSPKITNSFRLVQRPEERLEQQLALCGLSPEQIDTVVLSHMHFDHTGGLYLFPDAEVYAPRADFTAAQARVRCNPDPFTHGGYCKADLDLCSNVYTLVDTDFTLLPGLEVVQLPGHTPGLMGLIVRLAGGTVLLPQDCVYTAANYGPPVRRTGSAFSWELYHSSIEKLRTLQAQEDALIFFAHDWENFQTLKRAPEYYE